MSDVLTEVAALVRRAERILFITGAGVSADSGLPTYRGIGGLYDRNTTAEGVPIEVALSGPMFRAHPEITWKYLWEIGAACAGRTFNRAHEVMAEIERWKPGTWVLTQNVDGFHRAAGSRNLIEVHGDIFELRCLQCRARYSAEDLISGYRKAVRLPPACPACGGLVRPEVVLFEEALPEECVTAMRGLADSAWDLVVAVGTSAVFPYIAGPVLHAKAARVPTVEVNPGWTELSAHVDHRIVEAAAAAFGKLWDLLRSEGSRSEDHGRREVSNEPS